ncbi:MAG: HEAT repeat domain-containing protein [Planctomycetes bacterium]|nr:HEAT repeat domain-containing protein [Planctomycetota bacterium]
MARSADPAEIESLAATLGRLRDPEVEAWALELAAGAASWRLRAAAFDILDALDTPAARDVALSALRRESEVEVRRSALYALGEPEGVSREEARPVTAELAAVLARDADGEARRRAAVLLGTWGEGAGDLAPVVAALERDPDPGVRAGCAFALELARDRTGAVVAALARTVAAPGEDPLVRENAWRALGALGPLPSEAQGAWLAFREEYESAQEAVR